MLEMAALKDAGGIGAFPSMSHVLEQRQSSPWRAGFYSPGVAGTAFLKASSAGRERRVHTTTLKGAAGLKQVPAEHLCSTRCNKDDSEVY